MKHSEAATGQPGNEGPPYLAKMGYRGFEPGRPFLVRTAWYLTQALIFSNPVFTSYSLKRWLLRLFGAEIGTGVLIKPRVQIKSPWFLSIGDDSWIGEGVWIDNFVQVQIGANACVSQGAYLCTGNHDWSDQSMDLIVRPIAVEDGAWVGAFARVGPDVTIGYRSVVAMGSIVLSDTDPDGIFGGHPAVRLGTRTIREGGTNRWN